MVSEKIINSIIISSHGKIWDQLKNISFSNRIGNAYLFSGPPGCGKEFISIQFAQLLNCEQSQVEICGVCASCIRFSNLQHENLNLIFPLPVVKGKVENGQNEIDKTNLDLVNHAIKKKSKDPFFKIAIPKANRILIQSIRRLRKTLYLKSHTSGRKILLVFDSHLLNKGQGEAANAFLKILEEPPANTTIILVTDYAKLLLPTILSRCHKIDFSKFNNQFMGQWCKEKSVRDSDKSLLVGLSRGNIHRANALIAEPLEDLMQSISKLIQTITNNNPDHWRIFVNTYSQISKRNESKFFFHFYILKIWFQSANRLNKKIVHILHSTSFVDEMKRFNQTYPKTDFSSIIYEIEKLTSAISKNYFMPLVLLNFLLEIQKHIKK